MEIRTKHLRASFEAGFEAGLEGLKPMEIEAKQYDKEGALFWSSKRKKKQARKKGPPQYTTYPCLHVGNYRRTDLQSVWRALIAYRQRGTRELSRSDRWIEVLSMTVHRGLGEAVQTGVILALG